MDKLPSRFPAALPDAAKRVPAKVQQASKQVQQASKQAAEWSETAFKEVYSRYIRPVNAYILHRVRNHHDAEDLTAQVFVQALDHLDPGNSNPDEVASWLFTSAHNATVNHSRRRRYVVSVEEVPESVDASEDPGELVLNEERLGQVLDAIANLPEERRRAIILRFVEQLPHAEIAEMLGRTETSARVLLHRTIAHLRKEVS